MNPRDQNAGHASHDDHANPGGQVDQTPNKISFNPSQAIKLNRQELDKE